MTDTQTWPSTTLEWLRVEISNDQGIVLDAQDVWLAVIPVGQEEPLDEDESDLEADWYPAEWVGTAGTTRVARVLFGLGGTIEKLDGKYKRWYRVEANPEDIKRPVPGLLIVT